MRGAAVVEGAEPALCRLQEHAWFGLGLALGLGLGLGFGLAIGLGLGLG